MKKMILMGLMLLLAMFSNADNDRGFYAKRGAIVYSMDVK